MALFINEFHYDNLSTDTGEFIEVAGPAGTDLTGWRVVLYNGSNGNSYNTIPLSGMLADQQDGFGFTVIDFGVNGIQNGPDGIALVDPANAVVEFLSYEGSFTANDGPAAGMTSTDIRVFESFDTPTGQSLQRVGFGDEAADFAFAAPQAETPGAVNAMQSFGDGLPPVDPTPRATGDILFRVAAEFQGASDPEDDDSPEGASEVVAHENGRLYVTNGNLDRIDVFDIATETQVGFIPLDGLPGYDGVQSVDVKNGVVAVAVARAPVENAILGQPVSQPGFVALFNAADFALLSTVDVGNLPDQLTFSVDGATLLVAGEGERNADSAEDFVDNPLGTVAAIDVTDPTAPAAQLLDFSQLSGGDADQILRDLGVRIQAGVSFAQDAEPEYIAVSPDGQFAFVSLQENNAIAKIEIAKIGGAEDPIVDIFSLGVADFSEGNATGSALDPLDDGEIEIRNFDNLVGFRMADAIASFEIDGVTYVATANEGDSRDFDEARVSDLVEDGRLDPALVQDLTDQGLIDADDDTDIGLERLEVSSVDGDTDGDGDIDVLHTFSSRSFSIFDGEGNLVFDSGDDFERILADIAPERFNDDDGEDGENRSDAKGPEPEAITIGEIDGDLYAFIGLERDSGVVLYNISDPANAFFVNYLPPVFSGDDPLARQGPEVITFIAAEDSVSENAQIAVSYEISGSTIVYDLAPADAGFVPTLISAIQGSSDFSALAGAPVVGQDDRSPLEGELVTISAIVTGDFQDGANGPIGSDLNGFFVQEEDVDADGDPFTSEGLFVFDGSDALVDVAVGDLVTVTGTVSEFFGMTQLRADTVTVVSSGVALPSPTEVDFPAQGFMVDDDGDFVVDLEAVEGMLINIPTAMTITEMFNLDRFGEYRVASGDRPQQFTQTNAPDVAGFEAHQQDLAARELVLDDGRSDQNPETIEIIDGNDGVLTAEDSFRMGDQLTNLTGVVNYAFDEFRLQDATGDYAPTNPRPAEPDPVAGGLKVASFNVLNFFATIDDGATSTAIGLDPRGADDLTRFGGEGPAGEDPSAEFNRQLEKLLEAIVTIDADILGLVELENDFEPGAPGNAVERLVSELNFRLGDEVYDYVDPGLKFVGSDAISTGLIFKPAEVSQVGDAAVLLFKEASAVDTLEKASALNGFVSEDDRVEELQRNRPAVAATFEDENGERLTIAVNHFKSKGDSNLEDTILDAQHFGAPEDLINALLADPNYDQGDGQGFWNQVRADAAAELAAWLATDPTGSGDPDALIIGDLNAYAQEDPIKVLAAAGYTDLVGDAFGAEASSFVFDGQTGTLDYALANASLLDQVAGVTEWAINADEADAIDYNLDFRRDPTLFNGETPARNSDHDPVIVGLDLEGDRKPSIVGDADANRLEGSREAENLFGEGADDTLIGRAGDDCLFGGDGDDRLNGNRGDDTLVGGAGDDRLKGAKGDDVLTGGVEGSSNSNPGNTQDRNAFVVGWGNDTITDFDLNAGRENSFDKLIIRGQDDLNARIRDKGDLIDYVVRIESDGDVATDAAQDGDDLVLVFDRAGPGTRDTVTDSVRLVDLFATDDLSVAELEVAIGRPLDTLDEDELVG